MTPPSHCASCGTQFVCGMGDPRGCWCAGLPHLPADALVAGTDCLCEACLRARLALATEAATARADCR